MNLFDRRFQLIRDNKILRIHVSYQRSMHNAGQLMICNEKMWNISFTDSMWYIQACKLLKLEHNIFFIIY